MDLIGDIVEHDIEAPTPPTFEPLKKQTTGFPAPRRGIKGSAWKRRHGIKTQSEPESQASTPAPTSKDGYELDSKTGLKRLPKNEQKLNYDNLSEAEKIHMENIEILSKMSEDQRAQEKQELLDSMDPGVLKALLLRSEKKLNKKSEAEFEGYGDWIGGDRNGEAWKEPTLDKTAVDKALGIKSSNELENDLSKEKVSSNDKKKVRFDEEDRTVHNEQPVSKVDEMKHVGTLDADDIAPPSYQINNEADSIPLEEAIANVHFPKAPVDDEETYKLDINDPDFQNKLHEKYFPDLPKDTDKLKWMEPLPDLKPGEHVFDNVSDLRFDFKGDLIVPSGANDIAITEGLHHHSENPALAGYNLTELAHLSRSTVSSQRCIAIRTLGRILHKLGKGKFNIVPEFETDEDGEEIPVNDETLKSAADEFDQMFWGLIDELRIIETLEESASEKFTNNLSVRNYAIEALWLWRQGGGNKRHAK
ncbi:RNA polymerase II-associated protein RBA50 [Wickerhamomyces ciferrii]|uniref:RNA polymerase II-associated protein RBA50 n=1 Tax=Wickerhamomyces ciferrii (strain ATCC 14091 / BCRC 22168 / CBS 111 / JCM 3599 / NBRC 0793 / NRRL Y-1031 F-60-10) TaxID=1206466 RepID=K0KE95_WICCF|nr:RNA polymerase II-associated protein RBA50 [Wickerhamomyces ciferrii]CCH41236.1 RNA polymerase II-associated protein RBA50 [Wickerhamomyces ciferrii]